MPTGQLLRVDANCCVKIDAPALILLQRMRMRVPVPVPAISLSLANVSMAGMCANVIYAGSQHTVHPEADGSARPL